MYTNQLKMDTNLITGIASKLLALKGIFVNKSDLLEKVKKTLSNRGPYYGTPQDNYGRAATLWSVILDRDIKPAQVVMCMVAIKMAREAERHKHDNIMDMIGYLTLYDELMEGRCDDQFTNHQKIVKRKRGRPPKQKSSSAAK